MTTQDPLIFFDELSIIKLKAHLMETAEYFNQEYPVIRRIILYRRTSTAHLTKYLLLFDVAESGKIDKKHRDYLKVILNVIAAGEGDALVSEYEYKNFYRNPPERPETEWEIYYTKTQKFELYPKYVIQSSELVLYEYAKQVGKKAPKEIRSCNFEIDSLIIWVESDEQISIRIKERKRKFYSPSDLKYPGVNANGWKALLEVLRYSPHIYEVGTAAKENKNEYNRRNAELRKMSENIIFILNRDFGANIPNGFKLYEIDRNKGHGKYRFKFGISKKDESKTRERWSYDQSIKKTKRKLFSDLAELSKKFKDDPSTDWIPLAMQNTTKALKDVYSVSEREIDEFLKNKSLRDEIKKDFSEHLPDFDLPIKNSL